MFSRRVNSLPYSCLVPPKPQGIATRNLHVSQVARMKDRATVVEYLPRNLMLSQMLKLIKQFVGNLITL